jgi:hypothetical protein
MSLVKKYTKSQLKSTTLHTILKKRKLSNNFLKYLVLLTKNSLFLNRKTKLDSENIVAELVHGFLIPETQKQVYRQNCKINIFFKTF